jgi:uncharacterized protein YdiU (UPF0061 family)
MLDHLQGMIDVHDSIAELQSTFKPSQGAVTLESHTQSSTSNLFSERQIRRLENQLEYRDQEIREIQNQLVKKFPPTSSVLKQNFELKDRIAHLQTELANKNDEVDKLKLHHIDLAGQHASMISKWCARYENVLADSEQARAAQLAILIRRPQPWINPLVALRNAVSECSIHGFKVRYLMIGKKQVKTTQKLPTNMKKLAIHRKKRKNFAPKLKSLS